MNGLLLLPIPLSVNNQLCSFSQFLATLIYCFGSPHFKCQPSHHVKPFPTTLRQLRVYTTCPVQKQQRAKISKFKYRKPKDQVIFSGILDQTIAKNQVIIGLQFITTSVHMKEDSSGMPLLFCVC